VRYHKSLLKKLCILLLILLLGTMNLPLMSIKTAAMELNGKSLIAYNTASVEDVAYSSKDLESILKNQLAQRQTSFTIRYKADVTNLKTIIESNVNEILKSDEYLESCIKSYQCSYKGYTNDVTISFEFSFYTTKPEEDYVSSQVTAILKDIIKVSMDDDQKERIIHDYIVSHVAYDTTLTKFSAYEALKNGTTVCSGYAQLAYRMLNESGIETKIVLGKGNNVDHAWNLVKIRDTWYHLDCTWDDPVPDVSGRVLYNYYNLNDTKISKDHIFIKSDYPAATKVYDNQLAIFNEKEFVQLTKSLSSTTVMSTKEWNINFNSEINELSLKDKIFICKQGINLYFPTILQLSVDKKTVKITHKVPFELGANYILYISRDINGLSKNINLKTSMKMNFTIFN